LWFVHAADAYVSASGDEASWAEKLEPACRQVIDAFCEGTDF
jgi:glycogen debranching enzyme